MDIENDIENFKKLGYKTMYEQLTELEEEIKMKKYFFKVVHTISELDKFIKNDIFKDAGVYSVELKQSYDLDIGEVFSNIEIFDINGKNIHKYNNQGNYIAEYELISDLLSHNNFVLEDNLYNNAITKKTITIQLNEDTKNVLKKHLLNETLLKAYSYMTMMDKNPPKQNQEKTMSRKI